MVPAASGQMVSAVLERISSRQPGIQRITVIVRDVGVAVGRARVQGRVDATSFFLDGLHKSFKRALAAALLPGQVHEVR